ncbi:MAG: hypothetical protein PHS94_02675 [Erysipelotrichaceae bacterium]|nr:hypothetical protein [Erysipelotrichaceae bacterium]
MKKLSNALVFFFVVCLVVGVAMISVGYGITDQKSFRLTDILGFGVIEDKDYQSLNLSDIENVKIEANSKVIFRQGDTLKLIYTTPSDSVSVSGDNLTVKEKNTNTIGFYFGKVKVDTIIIEYPADYEFSNVDLSIDVSSIIIDDLNALNLYIDNDAGSNEVNGGAIGNIDIDSDVGSTKIDGVDFGSLKGKVDVGSITINLIDDVSQYSMKLSGDVASIKVDGEDVGDYNSDGLSDKTIDLASDVGSIKINSR